MAISAEMSDDYAKKTSRLSTEILEISDTMCADQIKTMKLPEGKPWTIVDLGTADGMNAIPLFEKCVKEARCRSKTAPIQLVFEDGPWNNFGLITALDPEKFGPNTYTMVVNKGFFDPVMPAGSVHLSYTSHSMHYLTERPCLIKTGGIHIVNGSPEEKKLYEEQGAKDWERLLLARAEELAPGGRAVLSNLCINEDGWYLGSSDYGKSIYTELSDCIREMVEEGKMTTTEFEHATSAELYRTVAQIKAPFEDANSPVRKAGLVLKSAEVKITKCKHYRDWKEGKFASAEQYGKEFSWAVSSFGRHKVAKAFQNPTNKRSEAEQSKLCDAVFDKLAKRMAKEPLTFGYDNVVCVSIIEKEEKVPVEADVKPEEAEKEKKPIAYEGAAAGKYNWDDSRKGGDADQDVGGEAITKYSWSDGKKTVSIYIEMDGLDELAEDAFTVSNGEREVSLVIAGVAGKRRKFFLNALSEEIDGAKFVQKKGKSPNMVQLKLQKKEEKPWYSLTEKSGGGGGGDDDDEGGMGGMGGMPGMGGMDMASMMGGMGGMGM